MSEKDLEKMVAALDNGINKGDMIGKLKKAAEFLGNKPESINDAFGKLYVINSDCVNKLFNPHEKEGRHLLVEMMDKLTDEQWELYVDKLLHGVYMYIPIADRPKRGFYKWLITAPSDISFDCIMEVIG